MSLIPTNGCSAKMIFWSCAWEHWWPDVPHNNQIVTIFLTRGSCKEKFNKAELFWACLIFFQITSLMTGHSYNTLIWFRDSKYFLRVCQIPQLRSINMALAFLFLIAVLIALLFCCLRFIDFFCLFWCNAWKALK